MCDITRVFWKMLLKCLSDVRHVKGGTLFVCICAYACYTVYSGLNTIDRIGRQVDKVRYCF